MTTTTTRGRIVWTYVDGSTALRIDHADRIPGPRLRLVDTAPRDSGSLDLGPPTTEPARPVAPQRRARGRTLGLPTAWFFVLVGLIVMVGVAGVLLLNTKIAENAFQIDTLRQEQIKLDQQQQALDQALAKQESPGEVKAKAAREGLVPAGDAAYVDLSQGEVVGNPAPAVSGAPGPDEGTGQ